VCLFICDELTTVNLGAIVICCRVIGRPDLMVSIKEGAYNYIIFVVTISRFTDNKQQQQRCTDVDVNADTRVTFYTANVLSTGRFKKCGLNWKLRMLSNQ